MSVVEKQWKNNGRTPNSVNLLKNDTAAPTEMAATNLNDKRYFGAGVRKTTTMPTIGKRSLRTTKELEGESLATKVDKWALYDPECDDLDAWLDANLPSVLSRADHIGGICVNGNREDHWEGFCDLELLRNSWEQLQKSGEPINYHSISKLAKESNVLGGKWLFHVPSGYKVDIIWRKIAEHMTGGVLANLTTSAMVTPRDPSQENYYHVISVFNDDYTDVSAVLELNSALREAGVKARLFYKPDVYNCCGIYLNNEWKIRPSIYESTYDVLKRESTVISVYENVVEPNNNKMK